MLTPPADAIRAGSVHGMGGAGKPSFPVSWPASRSLKVRAATLRPELIETVKPLPSDPPATQPRFRRLAATLPLLLLLSACATTGPRPSTTSTVATPETWSQADATSGPLATAALADWWTRFNDPVLDQLIDEALAGGPDIRTTLSRIEQARSNRAVERSGLFPSITAGVSGQGSRTRNHETDTTVSGDSYSASLDAAWEIDLFGRRRLALDAASADLARTAEDFHATQVSLAAEVAIAYVNLRSAETQLAVVRRALAGREETARLTGWREQAGVGDVLATRQAVTSLEQARAAIPSLQQTITETRNQLSVLCGRAPGSLDALLASTAAVPAAPEALAVGIPAETLRQRPDIRSADHAVRAAAARSAAARRDRLPSLGLSGSLGVNADELGQLLSPTATVASLAGNLAAPIFNAGRIAHNIRIQDETTRQALVAYESAVLAALAEVENALASIRRNGERLAALDRATASAREADDLARRQYEAGAVDFFQVLDSERTLLGLEQSLVATTADLTSAHIRLYKALGGGWSSAETAPL